MTATAYIDENGNFSRVAWSLRHRGPAAVQGREAEPDKAAA